MGNSIFDDDSNGLANQISPSELLRRRQPESIGDPTGNAGLVGWWARNAGQFTALGVMLILFGLGSFAVLYQMDRMYRDALEERSIERSERKQEIEMRLKRDENSARHMREAEEELRQLNTGVRSLNTSIDELNRRIKGGAALNLPVDEG